MLYNPIIRKYPFKDMVELEIEFFKDENGQFWFKPEQLSTPLDIKMSEFSPILAKYHKSGAVEWMKFDGKYHYLVSENCVVNICVAQPGKKFLSWLKTQIRLMNGLFQYLRDLDNVRSTKISIPVRFKPVLAEIMGLQVAAIWPGR